MQLLHLQRPTPSRWAARGEDPTRGAGQFRATPPDLSAARTALRRVERSGLLSPLMSLCREVCRAHTVLCLGCGGWELSLLARALLKVSGMQGGGLLVRRTPQKAVNAPRSGRQRQWQRRGSGSSGSGSAYWRSRTSSAWCRCAGFPMRSCCCLDSSCPSCQMKLGVAGWAPPPLFLP